MNSVIDGVLGRWNDAGRDAGELFKRPVRRHRRLGSDHSPADMRSWWSTLIAATRANGKAHQEPGKRTAEILDPGP